MHLSDTKGNPQTLLSSCLLCSFIPRCLSIVRIPGTKALLGILSVLRVISLQFQQIINTLSSSLGFFPEFAVPETPDDVADVDAQFKDHPMSSG